MTCPKECQQQRETHTDDIAGLRLTTYGPDGRGGLVKESENAKSNIENKVTKEDFNDLKTCTDKKVTRRGVVLTVIPICAIIATFIIYGMEANSQQKARIAESEIRVAETKKDVEINHDNIADMKEIMSGIQTTQAQLARNQVVLMERQMDPEELLKSIAALINKK